MKRQDSRSPRMGMARQARNPSLDSTTRVRRRTLICGGLAVIVAVLALARPWQTWRRRWLDHATTAQLEEAVQKSPGEKYAWLALARNLEDRPRLPKTVAVLRTGLQQYPDDPDVMARVAIVDLTDGRDAEAGNRIDQALSKAPGSWDAHYAAALAYERRQMLPDAIAQLQALVTVRPKIPCLWYHLGICQVNTNNYKAGAKSLERAVSLDATQVEYLAALGRALKFMGDDAAAEAAYRRALLIRPGDAVLWRELGTLYAEWATGARPREAEAALRNALAINPQLLGTYESLGTLYEGERNWSAALHAWTAALKLHPTEESARLHLVTVYRQVGDVQRAQQEDAAEQAIARKNAVDQAAMARTATTPDAASSHSL